MSRKVAPDGKPVATLATLTFEPRRASFASADVSGVDAHRGDGRDGRVARLRTHRLDAHRPDLARRVLPLERRQVHHRDRELERPQLRRLLDRAPLEQIDPLLHPDLVDGGDPPEQAAQRPGPAVPRTDQLVGALAGRESGRRVAVMGRRGYTAFRSWSGAGATRSRVFGVEGLPGSIRFRDQESRSGSRAACRLPRCARRDYRSRFAFVGSLVRPFESAVSTGSRVRLWRGPAAGHPAMRRQGSSGWRQRKPRNSQNRDRS